MKKLMVVAAIVCAAACGQAAQFIWNAGAIKTFDGKSNYSGTAILTVIDAGGNTQTYEGTFADGYMMNAAGTAKGLLVGTAGADAGFIISGQKYSAYYTITDANGNVFTSSTKSNQTATDPSAKGIAFMAAGSWTAAPVPEPTSGLLLLLGVAGMALRRRRA